MNILQLLKTPTAIAAGVSALVLGVIVTAVGLSVTGSTATDTTETDSAKTDSGKTDSSKTDSDKTDSKKDDVVSPTTSKEDEEVVKAKRYNHVLFEEVWANKQGEQITPGNQTFKCRLEGGTHTGLCALSKVVEPEGKNNNWVSYAAFKKLDTDSQKIEDFITEDKTIYKAKVSWNLIDEWKDNQDKKLNIYPDAEITEETKPLTTVIPKFAIKQSGALIGNSKYMLGTVGVLHGASEDGSTSLKTTGNYFKCKNSGISKETDFKNCDIYYFDENDVVGKGFDNKQLTSTLKKAKEVSKGLHYLIKFDDEQKIMKTKYDVEDPIYMHVFSDVDRNIKQTKDFNAANFVYISHVLIIGDDENSVDLALIF